MRSCVKKGIRSLVFASKLVPVYRMAGAVRNRYGLCRIVMYHRFCDPADATTYGYPTAVQFAEQMAYLRRQYTLISLDELSAWLREKPQAKRDAHYAAVTFDDGYADVYSVALPVLKQYEIPATVFIAPGTIDEWHLLWWERLRRLLKSYRHNRDGIMAAVPGLAGHCSELLSLFDATPVADSYQQLQHAMKSMAETHRNELLNRWEAAWRAAGIDLPEESPLMDWETIHRSVAAGIVVGAHTMSHRILSRMAYNAKQQEITESKTVLEKRLGTGVRHFAYPNGKQADCGADVRQCVKDAGFQTAVSSEPGINRVGDDAFWLKRIGVSYGTLAEFACRLEGI